jgi:hypothetical protein
MHYIISAVPSDDITGLPVAETEIDAESEAEAIEKAKDEFRQKLTTLDDLVFHAIESE